MIKTRRMRWAGNVARMGENRNAYRILVGKRKGKRLLGRPRCRWVNNFKMDLREIDRSGKDWIDLIHVCMYKGWTIRSGPCIATFNDL
jgi:hypothetical protein